MMTGSTGTFVISWSQTELDGQKAAALDMLSVGATWRWQGQALRLDGPQHMLRLVGDQQVAELRGRAAQKVQRLFRPMLGAKVGGPETDPEVEDDPDRGFVITDGRHSFPVSLLEAEIGGGLLAVFPNGLPRADKDHWVVRVNQRRSAATVENAFDGGVICFTPGTMIATASGPRLIETLRVGDRILTKDDGPQAVVWTGQRQMTGARLFAMPHLRPVRIRTGALGIHRPDRDLIVSPQHRLLVRGRQAAALFNTPEVLVAAEDLVDGQTIQVDVALRSVVYVHILLERHQVVWANGLETESFHPSSTSLQTLDPAQLQTLLGVFPGLDANPQQYGGYARRNLTAPEAAILRYEAN